MTIFFLFLVLNLLTLTSFTVADQFNITETNVTAVLIFGDSTVDTGNNKYIKTVFQCNKPPYGKDFPGGVATGRCSNGKIPSDIIASELGLKDTVPPFLDPNLSDEDVITGVCFASAGSGYDNRTTSVSNVISVPRQLPYFKEYIQRLEGIVGKEKADGILKGALLVMSAGTNDIIITYPTMKLMAIEQYHDFLLNVLQKFVKDLYNLGCRNFIVAGLPPVGCLPLQRTLNGRIFDQCIDGQNKDAQKYNEKLRGNILPQLQANLTNSTIAYGDIYFPIFEIINKTQDYGLNETSKGCCGTGKLELGPLCSKLSPLCKNSSEYLFFDSIHPTTTAYTIIVKSLIKANVQKFFRLSSSNSTM